MSDKNQNDKATEKKPGFIAKFRTSRPRTFKAICITAGALTLGGAAYAAGVKTGSDSDAELDITLDSTTDSPSEA